MSSFCICKSYSQFFSKKYLCQCELDIVLTRTVNILTTNELVNLTMLWTTGPWISLLPRAMHRIYSPLFLSTVTWPQCPIASLSLLETHVCQKDLQSNIIYVVHIFKLFLYLYRKGTFRPKLLASFISPQKHMLCVHIKKASVRHF